LTYDLIANTQQFTRGLERAERIAQRRARAIKGALGVVGTALAGIQFGAIINSVTNTADQLDKLSIKLGVSVEELSALKHAADLSGVSFNAMAMAVQRMGRRVAEAAVGTGEAKDALKEMGINVQKFMELSLEKRLEVLADAFVEVKDSNVQLRLAMKLFDSEGVAMLQMLKNGSAGLREMTSEARALGVTMTGEDAKSLVRFKDELTKLSAELRGLAQDFVVSLGPALTTAVQKFRDLLGIVTKFFGLFSKPEAINTVEVLALKLNRLSAESDKLRNKLATQGSSDQWDGWKRRLDEVKTLMAETRQEMDKIVKAAVPTTDGTSGARGAPQPTSRDDAAAKAAASKREQMEAELEILRDGLKTQEQLELDSHIRRMERLAVLRDEGIIPSQQEFLDLQFAEIQQYDEKVRELEERRAAESMALAQKVADTKLALEKKVVDNAVGLLQLFGQKNKAFAVAAVVLQRAMALKEIIIEHAKTQSMLNMLEQVAVAQAYAQLGPIAGAAAEAGIRAKFAMMRGLATAGAALGGILEVASGIQEIANLNSSGGASTLASGVSGVALVDPLTGAPIVGSSAPSTTVTINLGNTKVFSDEAIRELIEAINEQIDDGVTIKGIMVA